MKMSGNKSQLKDVVEVLMKVEIFNKVPDAVITELAAKVVVSQLAHEVNIIRQGDEGSSMYVILSGSVKVHDKEYTIATIDAGNFFGEFSLLDDEPRSLSVTTLEQTVIGNIQQADFYQVLDNHPSITRDIIKVMLKRLRNQNQRIINQLREKQKELEELVRIRTLDLKQKNEDLESTLHELKHTQEQLVQQAKLASLGQITAGIAHEIQNPLNFINNFSILSKELAEEIIEANSNEEKVEIISDLKLNLSKIEEHGKRADKIVKGMLMHSKSSKGDRQETNISYLIEQAFGLAYNCVSSNYPQLECKIEKNIPADLPPVHIVPQDISRVIINIFNNAFYAVDQKSKNDKNGYMAEVDISLKEESGSVYISVRDNGTGIPARNKDKIFQPFFTTKPTGMGTGLGLSTGYEIVKAHGGEITWNSVENKFTEFIVRLPLQ